MSRTVDNLIAYRVLYMLVTPFNKTKAYELGIIDEKGKILRKVSELTTGAEKDAYSYLHRLVFSLKRLLGKVPGGSSRIASLAAAYYLIREYYEHNKSLVDLEEKFNNLTQQNITLVEEELVINDFLVHEFIQEDAPANVTGAGVSTDEPVFNVKKGRKYATFKVSDDIFRRFTQGKKKFKRWSEYLNIEDEYEAQIYNYAKRNPKGVLILKTQEDKIKAIRFNRNGGGAWSKIQRKNNNIVSTEVVR